MLQQLKAFLLRALDFLLRKRDLLFLKFERKNFEILDEIPITGPDNYAIFWGHNRVLT